jgi:hypothetical protein
MQNTRTITGIKTYREAESAWARAANSGEAAAASITSPDGGKTYTILLWLRN